MNLSKILTFRLNEAERAKLTNYAIDKTMRESTIIRAAVKEYMMKNPIEKKSSWIKQRA